jgi:hypothetical protein
MMTYKAKGMHAAANGIPCARKKLPTVRTILPKGRKQYTRLLDSWDMVGPTKAVVIPGSSESPTTPKISRKKRVSPLTKIAEKWGTTEWREQTKRLDLYHA